MHLPRTALKRLYWIDASLQREECLSAQALAAQIGVVRSTVHRDIARLSSAYKAPVIFDASLRGFRYGHPFVPQLPDLPVADALELGRALARQGSLQGTAFEAMARRLFEPLAELLRSAGEAKSEAETPEAGKPGNVPHPRPTASAPVSSRLGERVRPGCQRFEEAVVVRIRFDAAAAQPLLSERFLRREQAQFLTDGGMEATVETRDPDALLLDLLRWAPHFEIAHPAWVRRRLPTLLRTLLRHWEASPGRASAGRRKRKASPDARKRAPRQKPRPADKTRQTRMNGIA
ncbi:MAG: WYL domain-containing protein [Candidatus Eisenbacteria bacterium]|nr:WYL domain-containing protein [Candidatus Eisenbacteria bacterium]